MQETAIALVRRPGPRLAEGIVTHIARRDVDPERAAAQHGAYVTALESAGWPTRQVEPADELPDAVFVEDTVVVCDRLAVLTRPGAAPRRAEVSGTEAALADLGLEVVRVQAPATLDGGDVLQVGSTVYVGQGGRTNAEAIRQLRDLLAPLGRTVVPVGLRGVLHLKSAVTALPDGTLIGLADLVDAAALPGVRAVPEPAGAHVVPLGGDAILIATSAPRTAQLLDTLGFDVRAVDISEFEKLEGCVTCLSVLIPGR
jgi:dimethylargininase